MEFEILVVDDEQDYCDVLQMMLQGKEYKVKTANNGLEALKILGEKTFDLVITDLSMPGMDGMELMQEIKKKNIDVDIIMLTAFGTIEKAVQAMKLGAFGYVTKGNDPEELLIEVGKAAEVKRIQHENQMLRDKVEKKNHMLASQNKAFKNMLTLAERAAQSDSNILILGESGSGKEVLAGYIHEKSNRKEKNFMELNCQALSESILVSELFGHEKGSFTGAATRHIGLFEAANKGTLFLDEIGGVSMNLQAKLLKAIENKRIYRLGSTNPVDTDFRLITATNRNLQADMEIETFRSDLFYRISTIVLELPPLRERREDIPLFIDHFLAIYQKEMKKEIKDIHKDVRDFLINYNYPGNIRELKNIIERMVVLSGDGEILPEYLPGDILKHSGKVNSTSTFDTDQEVTLKEYRGQAEKSYIKSLVKRYTGDMDKVAETLGITRRQLFNKMTEYDLK